VRVFKQASPKGVRETSRHGHTHTHTRSHTTYSSPHPHIHHTHCRPGFKNLTLARLLDSFCPSCLRACLLDFASTGPWSESTRDGQPWVAKDVQTRRLCPSGRCELEEQRERQIHCPSLTCTPTAPVPPPLPGMYSFFCFCSLAACQSQ